MGPAQRQRGRVASSWPSLWGGGDGEGALCQGADSQRINAPQEACIKWKYTNHSSPKPQEDGFNHVIW